MPKMLNHESIPVALAQSGQLQLTRFFHDQKQLGVPVFMLHSSMQDGQTFYSEEGTGLACYLARQGFDVYVADWRAKCRSEKHGLTAMGAHQIITEYIPALLEKIIGKRGKIPQIWIGHGWGSVLLYSFYARFIDQYCPVLKMAHFAARRQIHLTTRRKKCLVEFVWKKLAPIGMALRGSVPSEILKMGTCNETSGVFADYLHWSLAENWLDAVDGFDYSEAIKQQIKPPGFYFAAAGDKAYGAVEDVRHFVNELGKHDGRIMLLGKSGGNLHDYNHLGMLQHRDCEKDHFPLLAKWLSAA